MSYSAHRRDALDPGQPVAHRASHARSCAVHVSQKFQVHRDVVLDRILQLCGVDLRLVPAGEDLVRAMETLEWIRWNGIGETSA
jgi:hypothetical protein